MFPSFSQLWWAVWADCVRDGVNCWLLAAGSQLLPAEALAIRPCLCEISSFLRPAALPLCMQTTTYKLALLRLLDRRSFGVRNTSRTPHTYPPHLHLHARSARRPSNFARPVRLHDYSRRGRAPVISTNYLPWGDKKFWPGWERGR